jgi:HEAT repeat protein
MLEQLIAALESAEVEERIAAVKQIGDGQHTSALPHLAETLREDIDAGVRYQAALTLAKFADPATTNDLLNALREDDLWVRVAVTDALIRIGQPSVTGLIEALRDENHAVRRAAAKALGKIGAGVAAKSLQGALLDVDTDVRRFAAEALGRIGDEGSINVLAEALRDEHERVRQAAAGALVKIGEPSIPVLLEATNDPDTSVTITAVFSLKELGYRPTQ